MNLADRKRTVAVALLSRYNAWHAACVADPRSRITTSLERQLWNHVNAHSGIGLPTTITASIGRWVAHVLKMRVDRLRGVVADPATTPVVPEPAEPEIEAVIATKLLEDEAYAEGLWEQPDQPEFER